MTILTDRELRPFDRVYADVTADIEAEAARLATPDSTWLLALVAAFQRERQLWNDRSELLAYRLRWHRFRSRLLRLVAGAYLHIAYDLPRALADDWPGVQTWASGPSKLDGQRIYFRLGAIFPNNMMRSARSVRTVGWPAVAAARLTDRALGSASIWVHDLRKGAWLHAEMLASAPDRAEREAAMAEAMAAALEDASGFFPWSVLRLLPPDDAVYASGWAGILAALAIASDWLQDAALLIIATAFATRELVRGRLRIAASSDFIERWGALTSEYVAFAVREPAGFEAYRQRRRGELGIGTAAAGSAASG